MVDPVWQLVCRSLHAGLSHRDLKEPCFAEKCVGAVAWSRAVYQSADQRLKVRIVFAVVHAQQWTLQRLHDDKPAPPVSNQLLPMRQGQCVVRVEEKAMLRPVCIGNLLIFWTRLAKSKANVRVEVHVPQEFTAVEPIIMNTCCFFVSLLFLLCCLLPRGAIVLSGCQNSRVADQLMFVFFIVKLF